MLAIRYNYLSAFEFFLKPHFSEFNFPRIMICIDRNHLRATQVLNDAHMIKHRFRDDESMAKDILVKLNETLLKCGLNPEKETAFLFPIF